MHKKWQDYDALTGDWKNEIQKEGWDGRGGEIEMTCH